MWRLSATAGHISEQQYQITENVFRMIELEVRHIVVPRVEVDFLTLQHSLERIRTSGTRASRSASSASTPGFVDLGDGRYELPGRVPLPEVEDRLGFELEDEEQEEEDTIGGHVTARLGRLPKKGDAVRVGPYRATVIDASRRRVQRLRLQPAPSEPPETPPEATGVAGA